MNQEVLDAFSPSSRKALALLARSPEDAAHFYNRLTVVRAALRIGIEVMEKAAPPGGIEVEKIAKLGAMYALGAVTAIECCMSTLESLHPELGKADTGKAPRDPSGKNGGSVRRLDLD